MKPSPLAALSFAFVSLIAPASGEPAAAAAPEAAKPVALPAPAVGTEAPDFEVPDADGAVRRLSEFRGKVVVLEWVNPGCPFVKKFYAPGRMQQWQKESVAKGVVWITVASTRRGHPDHLDGAGLKAWMSQQGGAPSVILADVSGALARRYAAKTTPHFFIIGADGKLVYKGAVDSIRSAKSEDIAKAAPHAINAVDAALAKRAATPAETAPYGCGVKL